MDTGINYITEGTFGCLFDARWGRTEEGKDVNHPINLPGISKESLQNVKRLFLLTWHPHVHALPWRYTDFEMFFSSGKDSSLSNSGQTLQIDNMEEYASENNLSLY